MKCYIFFTDEGYTFDPNHQEVNNMQLLGSAQGRDVLEALKHFKRDQPYLSQCAFKETMALECVGECDIIRNLPL